MLMFTSLGQLDILLLYLLNYIRQLPNSEFNQTDDEKHFFFYGRFFFLELF